MRDKLKRIWKMTKNLPTRGKLGVFLWLIGYPIGFLGGLLILNGQYTLGTILLLLPIFEGNFGMILAGKEVISSVRNEFFAKKEKETMINFNNTGHH